jgi:hypothetical protein
MRGDIDPHVVFVVLRCCFWIMNRGPLQVLVSAVRDMAALAVSDALVFQVRHGTCDV